MKGAHEGLTEADRLLQLLWRDRLLRYGKLLFVVLAGIGFVNVLIVLINLTPAEEDALQGALGTFLWVMAGGVVGYKAGRRDGEALVHHILRQILQVLLFLLGGRPLNHGSLAFAVVIFQ